MSPPRHLQTNQIDDYEPENVARLVETIGVERARLPAFQMAIRGLLAGAFIAFGALLYTLTLFDSDLGFGPTRLLGGLALSIGFIFALVRGTEVFGGNILVVMAWIDRRVSTPELLRNGGLVFIANFVGALGIVVLVYFSGALDLGAGAVGQTAAGIAAEKLQLSFGEAFIRGILCNILVCMAVWLSLVARNISGRIVAIVFPITAFAALGFEHSVANMYLIPIGLLTGGSYFDLSGFIGNLVPVTLGNIVGAVLLAFAWWLVYLRKPHND